MYQGFVYRLYPTRTQERELERVRETCRHFYNDLLAERKEAWEQRHESVSATAQARRVKERKATNPYAARVHSHVLRVVVDDLDKTFQAFFRRVRAGDTPGYPRFKGRNHWKGFGFKEYGNGFSVEGRRLRLHGIGRVAVRWHRPVEGQIKTLRIRKKSGKWYAAFSCIVDVPPPLPSTGQAVGIDVGLHSLLTTSDGDRIENPRWYRAGQRTLRVLQRRVARRKKGGANWHKAIRQLQRRHEQVANQRRDFLKKVAHHLVERYDTIVMEDLHISNLARNSHLSTSILDASWGYFAMHLSYKAEGAGRDVRIVDPAYTSKTCSRCGAPFEQEITLAVRWVHCTRCGLSLDRDHNAACNILKRAGTPPLAANVVRVLARVGQEAAEPVP